jgi:hypothetical protein
MHHELWLQYGLFLQVVERSVGNGTAIPSMPGTKHGSDANWPSGLPRTKTNSVRRRRQRKWRYETICWRNCKSCRTTWNIGMKPMWVPCTIASSVSMVPRAERRLMCTKRETFRRLRPWPPLASNDSTVPFFGPDSCPTSLNFAVHVCG